MNKSLLDFCLMFSCSEKPVFITPDQFRDECGYDGRPFDQKSMIDAYIGGRMDVRSVNDPLPECLQ